MNFNKQYKLYKVQKKGKNTKKKNLETWDSLVMSVAKMRNFHREEMESLNVFLLALP